MTKWTVQTKRADFAAWGAKFGIDPVTARIIRNRDLTEESDVQLYLYGGLKDLHDPHLLLDVEKLTDILVEKIKSGHNIRIIGDYDIDGVMSSYILKKALMHCGANPSVVIPDRIVDGYGLNARLVESAHAEGVDTILTCDNGIAALDEIALAKELGMTVLVTDHHEIPFYEEDGIRYEKKSLADAVVNAHQKDCKYPNKNLCGAAVAWKMVQVLYEKMGFPAEDAYEFLENVAFATVGDIMSLTGENRILVKEGLKRIHHTSNIGLKALIRQCSLQPEQIKAYHFGFVLGPCINATGRLDTAYRALELLLADKESVAVPIAVELVTMNDERKAMTVEGTNRAKELYVENGYENDRVLVIHLPEVHESIAGIIAGRIREAYHKPTFILTNHADGTPGLKGSGRSIEAYSMYERMCEANSIYEASHGCGLFEKFGGHPMAAGLSLPEENLEELRSILNEHDGLTEADLEEEVLIDVPMPVDYVTVDRIKELDILEPYGKDNERPVFADRELTILRMRTIGKNNNFLKFSMKNANGFRFDAVFFGDMGEMLSFLSEKYGAEEVEAGLRGGAVNFVISAIYKPEVDDFGGTERVKFEIRDYH